MQLKDSGNREEFGTGAVRDTRSGKGRFDLLPYDALHQLACVFEAGAKKYPERNWEAGIPVSRHIDSAIRHLLKAASGADDEQHLPLAMWNISAAIQTYIWAVNDKLPRTLVDRPMTLFDYESFSNPCLPVVEELPPIQCTKGETGDKVSEMDWLQFPSPPPDGAIRSEEINGVRVDYLTETSGVIAGQHYQGMDFKVALRRLENGTKSVDEEVELAQKS